MTKATYDLLELYMLSSMKDSAHDWEHIYRVGQASLQRVVL